MSVVLSPAFALLAGIAVALTVGNPWIVETRKLSRGLLAVAVVGLGAGMNLVTIARVGASGLLYTAVGISIAFLLGSVLARWLRVPRTVALLITVGTAICGGSAIAAVAPVIAAEEHDISISLVAVFLLNAVALLLFPFVGHQLGMSQPAFGMWAALAIHDTSSVVGASAAYGEQALAIATAAKLARALWIVPVTFALAYRQPTAPDVTPARPWFIAGFLATAALVTWIPSLQPAGHVVAQGAHYLLSITLFLIGTNLTRAALRQVGLRPLVLAVILWALLATATLLAITRGWVG